MDIQVKDNLISVQEMDFPFQVGIGTILFNKMQEANDKIAHIEHSTGKAETYSEYLNKCVNTAIAMRNRGIKQDDVIIVCSSLHSNDSVPIIASFFLGVRSASTDPRFSVQENVHLLQQLDSKIIFVSSDAVQLIEKVLDQLKNKPEVVVFGETSRYTAFSDFLTEFPESKLFRPILVKDLKQTARIAFSSGTSGLPKGIYLSHLCLLNAARDANILSDWVFYSTSPPSWTTYTIILIASILSKSCRIIVTDFDLPTFWKTLETYKVTFALISPMQVALLLQQPPPTSYDLSSLKVVIFGGASITEEQIISIRGYVPTSRMFNMYGLTEFGTVGLGFTIHDTLDLELSEKNPLSCGRPKRGFTYKIVDRVTEVPLGINQSGELRIKSVYQMNGYHKMDSSDQWDSDGFFRTGDIAHYDENYCFYVTDRVKEMFKYQSWQISPFKIESVLINHPKVKEAVVIGKPHLVDSDRPVALVILKTAAANSLTEDEIQQYVEEKVNNVHRLRGGVIFVKSLLITPNGKYRRRYMRELLIAGRISELQ